MHLMQHFNIHFLEVFAIRYNLVHYKKKSYFSETYFYKKWIQVE